VNVIGVGDDDDDGRWCQTRVFEVTVIVRKGAFGFAAAVVGHRAILVLPRVLATRSSARPTRYLIRDLGLIGPERFPREEGEGRKEGERPEVETSEGTLPAAL